MIKNNYKALLSIAFSAFVATFAQALTFEEFAKMSPKDAIEASHQWHRTGEATVIITSEKIIAEDKSGKNVEIPLQNEFFVSIAPWETFTHECSNHVPTGCLGELVQVPVHINITNKKTGEVLKDESIVTQKDGFIDLWLPRNEVFSVTITKDGKTAQEDIGTRKNDKTCITTMKLKS